MWSIKLKFKKKTMKSAKQNLAKTKMETKQMFTITLSSNISSIKKTYRT